MAKWEVYKSWTGAYWIAKHDWRATSHVTWDEAFAYAYRHAIAERMEIP